MLNFIAIFAPAMIATGFFDHMRNNKLSVRKLIYTYTSFLVFINITTYLVFLFVFHFRRLTFSDVFCLKYLGVGTVLAIIIPLILGLINIKLTIRVEDYDSKKSKKSKTK